MGRGPLLLEVEAVAEAIGVVDRHALMQRICRVLLPPKSQLVNGDGGYTASVQTQANTHSLIKY